MRPRILVVDDEPRSIELMARALRRVGVVDTAASGEEAAKKILAQTYHLVITDHRMPGLKGAELLERVAEYDERIGRVLITGYADMKATIDAINRGRLHAYVSKPWKPDQLVLIASTLIERSELSRRNEGLQEQLAKRNEELEIAMAECRRLSHGMRQKVGSGSAEMPIAPFLQHLRNRLAKASTAMIDLAQAEIERLLRTCDDLLELSGEAADLSPARYQGIDDLIRGVIAQVAQDAEDAGVSLHGRFSCATSPPLDGPRMSRALENVVRNAVEASPEGGGVRVESRCEGGAVVVHVIDEGPGWSDAIRDQVFDLFASFAKPGHCGVGLTLAKKIVEGHAGEVKILDGSGSGAVVEIRIPIP